MRIASNMIYNQMAQGLQDNLTKLDTLSTQIGTGKKISKPSDDVLGTLKAMDYKLSISQNNQAEQNITEATNYLNFQSTMLTQISDTLTTLKQLTSQTSGTTVDQTYYASQAAGLRDNLLDLSNSTYLNSYIFSGSQSNLSAYALDENPASPTVNHYVYQGDARQMSVSLGTGITSMAINIPGNSADPAVITPFGYNLQAVKTTTLSDGSLATFTPVADPAHNSITIGVQITDPNNNITDNFSFSNVIDVANFLSQAWQKKDVDGTTSLTVQQSTNRIEALTGALDDIKNQVLTIQGQAGIRETQLNDQKNRLVADTVTQQDNLSATEDADMDETIVSFQKIATTLNALRSASSRLLSQSLFDFLK
jgi:flagellar hook-associated protein 3